MAVSVSFLNAEVSGNVWTAVGNPGDICSKNDATTCTNTEEIYRNERFLDQGGRNEPPYLAAELGDDPAGSSVPLGPVNDGSWGGGGVIRTPLNSWYCSSFQAIGGRKKKNPGASLSCIIHRSPERLHVSMRGRPRVSLRPRSADT